MGYHTLLSISHDSFDRAEKNPLEFVQALKHYMNTGMSHEAERLHEASGYSVQVVSIRHHSDNFIISKSVPGFPTKLPFKEEQINTVERHGATMIEAATFLGETNKKRLTVAKLLDCIQRLFEYNIPFLGAVKGAKEADERMTRKLSDPNWRPSRAHVEGLRNTLREIVKAVEKT